MRNSPDPSLHRERERQMIEHVERLLDDDRLRLDTIRGRVPAVMLLLLCAFYCWLAWRWEPSFLEASGGRSGLA